MTATEQAQLRVVVLQMLRAKRDLGRQEDSLLNDVRMAGHSLDLKQLQAELAEIQQLQWIAPMELELGPRRWCITDIGMAKLSSHRI